MQWKILLLLFPLIASSLEAAIIAEGVLCMKDPIKIHSHVAGWIKEIDVKENEPVALQQRLFVIESGSGDREAREAEGAYEKGRAELEHQRSSYARKDTLFQENYLSLAELEEAKRDLISAEADVKALFAAYEQKQHAFESSSIRSPISGVVVHLAAVKGAFVASDSDDRPLCFIVPSTDKLIVEINISEKEIGKVAKGQPVVVRADVYPELSFPAHIEAVHWCPKEGEKGEACAYVATATVVDSGYFLRPGMHVKAEIDDKREIAK